MAGSRPGGNSNGAGCSVSPAKQRKVATTSTQTDQGRSRIAPSTTCTRYSEVKGLVDPPLSSSCNVSAPTSNSRAPSISALVTRWRRSSSSPIRFASASKATIASRARRGSATPNPSQTTRMVTSCPATASQRSWINWRMLSAATASGDGPSGAACRRVNARRGRSIRCPATGRRAARSTGRRG